MQLSVNCDVISDPKAVVSNLEVAEHFFGAREEITDSIKKFSQVSFFTKILAYPFIIY